MKKWNDMTSLSLLDDGAADNELPERAWEDLTLKSAKQLAEPKVVAPAAERNLDPRAVARAQAQAAAAQKKVFSSKPTLRQMMQEYNRPNARLSPIKSVTFAPGQTEFSFETVDLFEFPQIPGKILRPR